MKKQYKRITRNVITFQHGDDNEALVLAKLGMSNKCIMARTSLTSNQITYRLHKAKNVEENDYGYRVAFRNGVSPLAAQLIRDLHSVIQADIRKNVVQVIIHATPETIKVKD